MTIATFHFAAQASRLKYAIAPSASVTATGDSTIGIDGSVWTVVGAAGSVVGDWVLSAAAKDSVVVTAPSGTNKACILQRLVTTTVNGRTSQIATTCKIYSGIETICPNETDESSQTSGWAPLVNAGLLSGGGVLPSASFTGKVVLDGAASAEFDDGAADCVLGLPSQPYVVGSEYELLVVDATDLVYPTALDPDSNWDPFSAPYFIAVTATSSSTFVSVGKALTAPATSTPTISGLTVDASDLDKLIVPCSVACHFPNSDLTGVTLGGTMATPRTVSSVFAGNGTDEITLDLSGDLTITDTPTLVLASTRELCSMESGVKVAAGSHAISIVGAEYDWSGVAAAELWLRGRSGIGVADGAALSAGWTDAIGGYVFTEATDRPLYRATAGINGHPTVDFDGTNDKLQTATALSTILGAVGDFSLQAVVKVNGIASVASGIAAEAIVSDTANAMGLHLWDDSGTYRLIATTYETGVVLRVASATIGSTLPDTFIAECRLVGGNLIASVNGVDGTPVACLAPWSYAGNLRLGADSGGAGTNFADLEIAEVVLCSVGTKQTAGLAAWATYYNIT